MDVQLRVIGHPVPRSAPLPEYLVSAGLHIFWDHRERRVAGLGVLRTDGLGDRFLMHAGSMTRTFLRWSDAHGSDRACSEFLQKLVPCCRTPPWL